MSNLYTTKSLGRTWIPPSPSSPSLSAGRGMISPLFQHNSSQNSSGYFGSGSRSPLLETQPFRWSTRESMGPSTAGTWGPRWRWSKAYERIVLAAMLVALFWWFSRSRGRIHFNASYYLHWSSDAEVELELKNATWKDFAYVTYATNTEYLCNSVMMVERLWTLGAKADRLVLHSDAWSPTSTMGTENGTETYTLEASLLQKARDSYGAILQPITIQRPSEDATWGDSFTKLLAFNQTQYQRVLALDSDSTILRPMDELFLLPNTPVAMPRAYWLENELFDAITLITPSASSHERIQNAISNRGAEDFDMDIMNQVFGSSCMVLPHRDYSLVTGEFRKDNHAAYLGTEGEEWDAQRVLGDAKFAHFSDWPLGKPWTGSLRETWDEVRPKCKQEGSMEEDCQDREVWEGLYGDFRERRKAICGAEMAGWEKETEWEVSRLLGDVSPTTAAPGAFGTGGDV